MRTEAMITLATKLSIATCVAGMSWGLSHLPWMPSWEITWLAVVTLHVVGHDKDIWDLRARSNTEGGQT